MPERPSCRPLGREHREVARRLQLCVLRGHLHICDGIVIKRRRLVLEVEGLRSHGAWDEEILRAYYDRETTIVL